MKSCPRSLPLRRGLVLYSAIPRMTPTAHKPHTQYKAKYLAASPGAGSSVAHTNTAVTKRARDKEIVKSILLTRLRRLQASHPAKPFVMRLKPGTPIRNMLTGHSHNLSEWFAK